VSKGGEDGRSPLVLRAGHPRNSRKAIIGVARPQGLKWSGKVGQGETLISSWPLLAIRPQVAMGELATFWGGKGAAQEQSGRIRVTMDTFLPGLIDLNQDQQKGGRKTGTRCKSINGHRFPKPHISRSGDKRVEMGHQPQVS
jgi:hypothetical protein